MRRRYTRIIALIIAMMMAMALVAACADEDVDEPVDTGNEPAETTPVEPDDDDDDDDGYIVAMPEDVEVAETHLRVAQPMAPSHFDPTMTNEVPQSRANYLIFQTLVYLDGDNIIPGLATSWEFVDAETVVFTLREGVRFHDGSIMTAEDVVFSINRASASSHVDIITGMIAEAVALSDTEVQITTEFPFAPVLSHLSHTATGIVSQEVVERLGDEGHTLAPIGTGPFMFYNHVVGDHFELVRFDDFNSVVPGLPEGQLPEIERITFHLIPDAGVRTIALETGEVHVVVDVAAAEVAHIRNHPDLVMVEVPNFALNTWLGFNTERAPFDDIRVRQAIAYAIDIPTIVDVAWAGVGFVAEGPLPNTVPGFVAFPPIPHNIDRARELMAEAGLEDGFETDVWLNEGNPMRADAAVMIQAQLMALNIDVTVRIYEWATLLPDTAAGEHGMSLMGWTTATGDPDYGLFPLYHSSNHGDAGNRQFYTNARVDELLIAGRMETDPATRLEIYREAQELIMADLPIIPLWQAAELHAHRDNVQGFSVTPTGSIPLWNVVIGPAN